MTATSTHQPTISNKHIAAFAAAGTLTACTLTAIGTIPGPRYDLKDWLFVNVPIILVAAGLIFGLVVPRAARGPKPGTAAVVLGAVAVASFLVFYLGLPTILAAAGVACAAAAHARHGRWTPASVTALTLAAIATAAAVLLAFTG
jgi:hypothetical protein